MCFIRRTIAYLRLNMINFWCSRFGWASLWRSEVSFDAQCVYVCTWPGAEGIHTVHDSRSHNSATGIVTHAWRHHARKFSSLAIDSWVQPWRLDMSNLHHWSWTLVAHLLWQKVKCVCASRGAQHSARETQSCTTAESCSVRRPLKSHGRDMRLRPYVADY